MANADVFSDGFNAGLGNKAPKKQEKKSNPPQFKRGGKVKRTGVAKVHRGEVVLTASQAKTILRKKGSTKSRRKTYSKG